MEIFLYIICEIPYVLSLLMCIIYCIEYIKKTFDKDTKIKISIYKKLYLIILFILVIFIAFIPVFNFIIGIIITIEFSSLKKDIEYFINSIIVKSDTENGGMKDGN